MKKKIVQLVSFESIYNNNLQKKLNNDYGFAKDFELLELNIETDMLEFEKSKGITRFDDCNNLYKLIYFYYFNLYLISKYSYMKGSILHIQLVQAKYAFLIWFFKKIFIKIIVTFWGCDLLSANSIKIVLLKIISFFSDIITFETKTFSDVFKSKISKKYNDKIRIVDFGIEILSDIDSVNNFDIVSFKYKYGIDLKKKVIAIGYNRIIDHQHISVINSLINSNVKSEDIFIVFPWTYGIEAKGYRKNIESLVDGHFDYIFIDNELTNKEVAILRCLSDILIHVELTDVMSFSMLETLYAKNIVITGSWLPYEDIYEKGVSMEIVDCVEEVGERIKYLLNNDFDVNVLNKNKEIIGGLYSWDNCIDNWISLYK